MAIAHEFRAIEGGIEAGKRTLAKKAVNSVDSVNNRE